MKLYFGTGACSLACHIALYESGLQFSAEKVDLRTKEYAGGDFKQVNPLGYVPVLELDNGERLHECAAILQYVGDHAKTAGLMPKMETAERYRCVEWLTFVATELHKGFGPLWAPTIPEEVKQAARDRLAIRFDYVNKHLSNRPYLLGEAFTVADAYLFTILNWAFFHKLDMSKFAALASFMERMKARAGVMAALKAEGLA